MVDVQHIHCGGLLQRPEDVAGFGYALLARRLRRTENMADGGGRWWDGREGRRSGGDAGRGSYQMEGAFQNRTE